MENKNQLAFRESLEGLAPKKAIDQLSAMIPEGGEGASIAMLVAGVVKALPHGLTAEEVIQQVTDTLSVKQKEHQAQAGDKPGSSKMLTRRFYDSMLLEMRLMDAWEPSTQAEFFGHAFSSPIMTGALSHLSPFRKGEYGQLEQLALGAKAADCLHWVGMCENVQFAQIMETGAKVVRVIKPYADETKIFDQIRQTEELGAVAVAMDIDHAITSHGDVDVAQGERMARKTLAQMRSYVQATKLPFVFKGVLSVRDARMCQDIGAQGILVSHHGGRIAYSVPPVMLLPEIREAVGDSMTIFVDCGISSGMDAYKAMAWGANGVGVGTHLLPHVRKGGEIAVEKRLQEMTAELKGAMSFTGIHTCREFDPSVIHLRAF